MRSCEHFHCLQTLPKCVFFVSGEMKSHVNVALRTINIPTVGLKSTNFLALHAFRFLFDIFYVTAECKRYSQTSVIERFCSRLSRFPTKKFEISSSFLSSCHEKATEALFI